MIPGGVGRVGSIRFDRCFEDNRRGLLFVFFGRFDIHQLVDVPPFSAAVNAMNFLGSMARVDFDRVSLDHLGPAPRASKAVAGEILLALLVSHGWTFLLEVIALSGRTILRA